MASVLYGGGILNMRGSIQGQTHTKGRTGAVVKTRVKGVNPNTSAQTKVRRIMGEMNVNWKAALTDSDRAAWASFAAANPVVNSFGQTSILSGFQWFCKLNALSLAKSATSQITPPPSTAISSPITVSLTLTSGGSPVVSIDYTDTGMTGSEQMEIWMSPPMSPGRAYVSTQLRFVTDHGTAPPYNMTTVYEQVFGTCPTGPGLKTFARIRVVNANNGIASPAIQTSAIWA